MICGRIRNWATCIAAVVCLPLIAVAQSYVVSGEFNAFGPTPMTSLGGGQYQKVLRGFDPGTLFFFHAANAATNQPYPQQDARLLTDRMGNSTVNLFPGSVADGWQPTADRVGFSDPGAAWELFGSGLGWAANTSDVRGRMTYQGNGVHAVELNFAAASTVSFRFRAINVSGDPLAMLIGQTFASVSPPIAQTLGPGVVRFELDLPRGRWRISTPATSNVRFVNAAAPGPIEDGRTWNTAYRELSTALTATVGVPTVTQIWVAKGTYRPTAVGGPRTATFAMRSNLRVLGGFAGGELSEAQRRPGANTTVLAGDLQGNDPGPLDAGGDWSGLSVAPSYLADNSLHVVTFSNVAATGELDGFLIRGGAARQQDAPNSLGGGIYIEGGAPRITDCRLHRNWGTFGGGVYITSSSGSALMQRCSFIGNLAEGGGGGLSAQFQGRAILINCLFSGNLATDAPGAGGALWLESNSNLSLTNCTISQNSANDLGGGIYNQATLVASNCILWGNHASSGAVWMQQYLGGAFPISRCIVQGWTSPFGDSTTNGNDPLCVGADGADGVTGTLDDDLHLAWNSPAIDSGDRDADTDGATAGVQPLSVVTTVDLDGVPRFSNPYGVPGPPPVDRGAYEFRPVIYVDNRATTVGQGWSWQLPLLSVEEALQRVDATPNGTREIWIAGSSTAYLPMDTLNPGDTRSVVFRMRDRLIMRGGFLGTESDAAQREIGRSATILSGDLQQNDQAGFGNRADNAYHVVVANVANGPVQLDGLRIERGNANDFVAGVSSRDFGGGVGIVGGALTVTNCTVRECQAAQSGAGVYLPAGGGFTATGSSMSSGLSLGDGGGVGCDGGTLTLTDCALRNNTAARGGGLLSQGNPTVLNCDLAANTAASGGASFVTNTTSGSYSGVVFERNNTTGNSGAFDLNGTAGQSFPLMANLLWWGNINNNPSYPANGALRNVIANCGGAIALRDGMLDLQATMLDGVGPLTIQTAATLRAGNATRNRVQPSVLSLPTVGLGNIWIRAAQVLRVDGDCLDMSGGGACGAPGNPASAASWGKIVVDGTLEVQAGTVQNSDITVHNSVTAESCGRSVGGRIVAKSGALIRSNRITAYGDRYMDIAPGAVGAAQVGNSLNVIIEADPGAINGEILTARSPAGGVPDQWVLDSLTVRSGAKVNLVRRDGFDNLGTGNSVYARNVTIEAGGLLNVATGTNFYCGPPWLPCAGSGITSEPLLGFDLEVIHMEDVCEFEVRIDPRERDTNSTNVGQVQLGYDFDFGGVMYMATGSASSVAAKGSFGRVGEDKVVVAFRYKFLANSPTTRIDVFLSDSAYVGQSLLPLARITEPAAGKPGSRSGTTLAWFFGWFPRGTLQLQTGSYVEVQLVGTNSSVYIDDFDPYISCESLACGDVSVTGTYDYEDYLAALTSLGESFAPVNDTLAFDKDCYDKFGVRDRYSDVSDLVSRDAALAPIPAGSFDPCEVTAYQPATPEARSAPAGTKYLIAGHTYEADPESDNKLYAFDASNTCTSTMNAPGPAIDAGIVGGHRRGYGRLIKRPSDGAVCQLHATYGLIDVAAGAYVFKSPTLPMNWPTSGPATAQVYVSPMCVSGTVQGPPLTDAAFSMTNPNIVYVTPVWVAPTSGTPYSATAALNTSTTPPTLVQLYGPTPDDPGNSVSLVETGGLIVYSPDKYRPRELEIDAQGNLFVTSAQAMNDEHYIMVFNTNIATTAPTYTLDLTSLSVGEAAIPPSAMFLSQLSPNTLLLASGCNTDPLNTLIYRYAITRSGSGVVSGLTFANSVSIAQPNLGSAFGQKAHIAAIAEDIYGTVRAIGVVAPAYASTDVLPSDSFAIATSVVVPSSGTATATQIATGATTARLAAPVSIIYPGKPCPEDLNSDGRIDLTDLAILLTNFGRMGGVTLAMGDIDGSGRIDLTDLARLLTRFGTNC